MSRDLNVLRISNAHKKIEKQIEKKKLLPTPKKWRKIQNNSASRV